MWHNCRCVVCELVCSCWGVGSSTHSILQTAMPQHLSNPSPTHPSPALLPLLLLLPHIFSPLLLSTASLCLRIATTTSTTPPTGANLPALRHWLKSIRESTYLTVQFAAAHLGPAFWRHEQLASIIPQVHAGRVWGWVGVG